MKFTRLELLSSFDRLAQSVLLVTLDIEAADLRERAVAETRDQALFELLSLAFDILSAVLELTHSRACEFEKGLGHYAPSLIRRESCHLDLRGHLDRPSSISAGWKEAARREQRCGRSPNVGGAGPIAAPWVPPPTATP